MNYFKLFMLLVMSAVFVTSCNEEEALLNSETKANKEMLVETIGAVAYDIVTTATGEEEVRFLGDGAAQKMETFFKDNPDFVTHLEIDENGIDVTIGINEASTLLPPAIAETADTSEDEVAANRNCSWVVTFWDDTNYEDRYLRISSSSSYYADSNLKDTWSTFPKKKGFNDKTSSLKVVPPCCECNNSSGSPVILRLELYQHINYGGVKLTANVLNPVAVPSLKPYNFNDKLSSFKIRLI